MKLRLLLVFVMCALVFMMAADSKAQQSRDIARVGYISGAGDSTNPGPFFDSFLRALNELGYREGTNIKIDYRFAKGKLDRIPHLVQELVKLNVDVIVSPVAPAVQEAKRATSSIPIVMIILEDPVGSGLVQSLARPGGNVTGVTRQTRELAGKRLELTAEVVPKLSRVGIIWDAESTSARNGLKDYNSAARALNLEIRSFELRSPPEADIHAISAAVSKSDIRALIPIRNSLLNRLAKPIAELSVKQRLPSICEGSDFSIAGCLISYAANDADSYRRAAFYVDKILKGAKPAELPVEQPTRFELVINLKTAKQIDLRMPPNLLARADKVIR